MSAPYRLTRMPDGVRVVTARMPRMRSVALGIWVGAGGRHEAGRENGAAHFIEHMLFKGTRRRSATGISRAVEGVGGYLNAFTDEEHTCFYSRAVSERLPELADVLLDMFHNSLLSPAEIAKERSVILEEQAMYLDQPHEHVHDLLNAAQFPGHPLGRPVIGTAASVKALRRRDLARFLETRHVAENTVVAAAGEVDHDALVAIVAQGPRFRPGRPPAAVPAPDPPGKPAVRLHSRRTEQTHMALGIRTVSRHDERRFAARLLNVLLGENMSSRLFDVLRETHGLAYSIQSTATAWSDCGDIAIGAGLDDSNLEKALGLIVRELGRLASRPPSRAELARARDYALGQAQLALEGSEQRMMWLGEQVLGHGRVTPPAESQARLAAVTPAEIRSAAREFFHPGRCALAMVSPRRGDRGLARIVGRLAG